MTIPSSWAAGFALGLCLAAALGLAALDRGQPVPWQQCATLIVFGLGLLPSLEFAARAAWAMLTAVGGAWLEWRERTAPEPVVVDDPEPIVIGEDISRLQRSRQFEIAHWHTYYRRIMAAGWAYGFDIRTLTDPTRDTRVTSAPGWNTATGRIKDAGFIVKDNTGTRPTVSEAEWEAGRLWEQVTCPIGEPPDIVAPPYTRQQTQRETPAKHRAEPPPRVIEHAPLNN